MTPIERVARAICRERDPDDIGGGAHPMGQWLDEGELWWTGYADTVRAVLTAIREPSKAVEKAGMDAAGGDGAVLAGYEAMIDAMLDEG